MEVPQSGSASSFSHVRSGLLTGSPTENSLAIGPTITTWHRDAPHSQRHERPITMNASTGERNAPIAGVVSRDSVAVVNRAPRQGNANRRAQTAALIQTERNDPRLTYNDYMRDRGTTQALKRFGGTLADLTYWRRTANAINYSGHPGAIAADDQAISKKNRSLKKSGQSVLSQAQAYDFVQARRVIRLQCRLAEYPQAHETPAPSDRQKATNAGSAVGNKRRRVQLVGGDDTGPSRTSKRLASRRVDPVHSSAFTIVSPVNGVNAPLRAKNFIAFTRRIAAGLQAGDIVPHGNL